MTSTIAEHGSEGTQKGWTIVLTSLASFMIGLDSLVVATSLGAVRRALGASIEALQWTMSAYNLSFAVLLLTGAALGDRLGRRRVFSAGLGLFVAGSIACARAESAATLIAARAFQGVGAALVMPLAMAILGEAFRGGERAKALGLFSGVTGLALIAGPVAGGIIADGIAWQWIFWINVPIGLALILLSRGRLRESFGPSAAIDLAGLMLVTGAALGAVWGLIRGNRAGWTSPEVVASLAGGALLAAGFVARERRAAEPMLPLQFFRSRAFSSSIAASFLFYGAIYGCVFLLPQFFQVAQGHGSLRAGVRLLPLTATLMVVAPISGSAVNRMGERRLVAAGLLFFGAALAWIALTAAPGVAYWRLAVPLVVGGVGLSLAIPAAQSAVLGSVKAAEVGKASGVFNMARFLGGVFGIAFVVAVFATSGSLSSADEFSAGFTRGIAACSGLALLGAVAGARLPAVRRESEKPRS